MIYLKIPILHRRKRHSSPPASLPFLPTSSFSNPFPPRHCHQRADHSLDRLQSVISLLAQDLREQLRLHICHNVSTILLKPNFSQTRCTAARTCNGVVTAARLTGSSVRRTVGGGGRSAWCQRRRPSLPNARSRAPWTCLVCRSL